MDGASRSIKCVCVCCDCNSSCHVRTVRESRLKAKRATEITKQWNTVLKTGLPSCQYHATFWRTELARTWKEPKDGWNLWCNFYFCESRPHQYQRLVVRNGHSLTPMWQIKSSPIARNMPCSYMNHMWLGQFYDILPILQTSRGWTIQCLSSKMSQHSPTWISLPASSLFSVSTSCFQAGRLSVERPQTARKYVHVIQWVHAEAQVTCLKTLRNHV